MKTSQFLPLLIAIVVRTASPAQGQVTPAQPIPASADGAAKAIPFDHLGTEAQKQYSGDGISITPTADGARLKAVFQRLEGQATSEGLWLESTTEEDAGKAARFRDRAMAIGRSVQERDVDASPSSLLATTGTIRATRESAVFLRPMLTEEYTVSMDGVRQDFVVLDRPMGEGKLSVNLEVTGARAETARGGARLILEGSGRKIAYSRLHVTDATGRELAARIEVAGAGNLQVLVDDNDAAYPVRIDPTFSDADWISMGGVPGTNQEIHAMAVDGTGNVYVGGNFTEVAELAANHIAKWNGSAWSILGSGVNGPVEAIAVSGTDVYAGGNFNTAGGLEVFYVAKWDGSAWSAVGSEPPVGPALALAVSGTDLYVGGVIHNIAGGVTANHIAKWNGSVWSTLGSGTDGVVSSLAVSGTDVYAGGDFHTAGGWNVSNIAKWNGSNWNPLGAGTTGRVWALAVLGTDIVAGGDFEIAGITGASNIAKWNGSAWSPLDTGASWVVQSLAVSGTDLYAGGAFAAAGVVSANHIAKWNGFAWSVLG